MPGTEGRRPHAGRRTYFWTFLLALALVPGLVSAGDPPPTFENDVLPILSAACIKCHGGDKPKAGLDLRTPSTIRRRSKDGAVIMAGAEESPLY